MNLTEPELNIVASLVRQDIRKSHRKIAALIRKFGDEAELWPLETRIAVLESVYRELVGKDPENITYVE